MRTGLSRRLRAAVIATAVLGALWIGPADAFAAYSASGAVTWANNHADTGSANCQLSPCLTNDCASFVSQVLWWGGGYTQTTPKTTNTHDHHFWWMKVVGSGFGFTDSWGGAAALYDFQILHYPGGTLVATKSGDDQNAASGIFAGSLFFYDWTGNGTIDHVAIHVGSGTDPHSGWTGDYVDQHSTDGNHFYHGFWSDKPYNPNHTATKIYTVRISSSN